jgi:hypothetical protein
MNIINIKKTNKNVNYSDTIFLSKINKLPENIVNIIFDYLPNKTILFTNKDYYSKYHKIIKNYIINFESYIRDIIRRDNDYVFNQFINDNISSMIKNKNYYYNNMIFANKFYFIRHYCIENQSDNCNKILFKYIQQYDLCKNLNKKKIVKYIRWKN